MAKQIIGFRNGITKGHNGNLSTQEGKLPREISYIFLWLTLAQALAMMLKRMRRKTEISNAASMMGKIGGKAGRGKVKRRGDSNYYSKLAKKRKK